MATINTIFDSYFDMIETTLADDVVQEGENGTGYFDGLTNLDGEGLDRAKFTDRHGRKGVVLFTTLGNVVIFQRYRDGDIFVSNVSPAFRSVVMNGAMGKEYLEWMLNSYPVNAAQTIVDTILKAAKVRGL